MYQFEKRRSIRKYSDKPIDNKLLKQLLTSAEQTQTMGNLQLYSVIITRDKSKKAALAPAHFNQPMATEAPVVLTFCADYNRSTQWCMQRRATPGYDNFLSFLNAAIDTLLYCQTFCNMAEQQGLGLCFLGTTIYNPQQIIDTLKLPRLVMPIATITLGWPDEEGSVSDRLPINAIIHNEEYQAYSPEDINRHYTPKEQLPENKHFVEINNMQTLAQVYTDLRYKPDDCRAMSKVLLNTLRNQGFL
ncbi:MAG: nitroreductase family protein [Prevotellaceae bacterium]|nr:nitroreductase family protein [Prevotellaceae bacterium]